MQELGIKSTMDRRTLIKRILEFELNMFQAVPAKEYNRCREQPEAFRLHREAQFSIFSEDTLESYLDDIIHAKKEGINLMTMKYARMEYLIPRFNANPLIDEVAGIMVDWQLQMVQEYREFMKHARSVTTENDSQNQTSFETYLRGELETYSEKTLSLLLHDLEKLVADGKNGSEEIYRFLVQAASSRTTASGQRQAK